jgi:hypothetical protein
LEFSFLLSSCLDIFEARAPHKTADQDFGLLQAVDERLAMYGWITNTGIKIVIVVDMAARVIRDSKANAGGAFRESDVKPVSWSHAPRSPDYQPGSGLSLRAVSLHQSPAKSILHAR